MFIKLWNRLWNRTIWKRNLMNHCSWRANRRFPASCSCCVSPHLSIHHNTKCPKEPHNSLLLPFLPRRTDDSQVVLRNLRYGIEGIVKAQTWKNLLTMCKVTWINVEVRRRKGKRSTVLEKLWSACHSPLPSPSLFPLSCCQCSWLGFWKMLSAWWKSKDNTSF